VAQQNATAFLSKAPPQPQQQSGPDFSMIGAKLGSAIANALPQSTSVPLTMPGTGPAPAPNGVWSPNLNAGPGDNMFGSYQSSVQPNIAPYTTQLNVQAPALSSAQSILSRIFQR
jgi:hypothetical protein